MATPERPQRTVPTPYKAGFETYLSPFTFRYGSDGMRQIWSRENYWKLARKVWVATARVQHKTGLVTQEELDELISAQDDLSVERIDELEKEFGHDIIGGIHEFSEAAPAGGRILHRGLTSEDVLSNVETIQIYESFGVMREGLTGALRAFADPIEKYSGTVAMGFTHIQAAEPVTVGYRFAKYAQNLLLDFRLLNSIEMMITAKGIKGPVGTSASVGEVLDQTFMTLEEHEDEIMKELGLEATLITDQTYPRKFLFLTEAVLSSIGQSLHNFSLDMRILQSTPFGEVAEPRRKKQRGSSAMPHKQNPIHAENIGSLTMSLPGILNTAWMTGATVILERVLTDSAGKRSWLPESFLIVDESLERTRKIMAGVKIHEEVIKANLKRYAPFSATEPLIELLVKAGMDRKEADERLVVHAERAHDHVRLGEPNFFKDFVLTDTAITVLIPSAKIHEAFRKVETHVGNAPKLCQEFLETKLFPAIGGKPEDPEAM